MIVSNHSTKWQDEDERTHAAPHAPSEPPFLRRAFQTSRLVESTNSAFVVPSHPLQACRVDDTDKRASRRPSIHSSNSSGGTYAIIISLVRSTSVVVG